MGESNGNIMCGLQDAEESVNLVRKRPPEHYLLKIESLSHLRSKIPKSSTGSNFQSSEFTAAGYKWVMSIYLEGNKEDSGDGHISIYSKMINHSGSSVNAMLRFFVYDHIKRNYHVTEVDHLFSTIKAETGVSKFVSQDHFYDPLNGFVENDRCAFGLEVFVLESTTKFASLSLNHIPKSPTYTWNIQEFSKLRARVDSPAFITEGCSWVLCLHPVGDHKNVRGNYLSLYLKVDNVDGVGKKALVEYDVCLKNQLTEDRTYKLSATNWFPLPDSNWGWRRFMALSDLNDPSKGFKVDDTVIVEVTIISVFMLN